MANNYSEGTGTLVFDGEPKLSPISEIVMDHVHRSGGDGFYLDEGGIRRGR